MAISMKFPSLKTNSPLRPLKKYGRIPSQEPEAKDRLPGFFIHFSILIINEVIPPQKKSNMNMSPKKYSGWPRRNDVLFMVVMGMKLPSFPKGQPQKGTRTQNITARSTYLPPPHFSHLVPPPEIEGLRAGLRETNGFSLSPH